MKNLVSRPFIMKLLLRVHTHAQVYWIGPILGGCVAGFLYESLFAANASVAKAKDYLLTADGGETKFSRQTSYSRVHRRDDEIAVVDMNVSA